MTNMLNPKPKIYLIFFLIILFLSCRKDIEVKIDNNQHYIVKKMNSKLVINLRSHKSEVIKINFILHNLTDDITDMPIFQRELQVFPEANIYVIKLNEIGIGKYSLRLYYQKDLIDYRILEVLSE